MLAWFSSTFICLFVESIFFHDVFDSLDAVVKLVWSLRSFWAKLFLYLFEHRKSLLDLCVLLDVVSRCFLAHLLQRGRVLIF